MIRAVYREGKIEPVERIPGDWLDGQELEIKQTGGQLSADELADLDAWMVEVEAAAAKIPDEDHDKFMAAIAEHRARAKEWMRREMGLAE